MTGASQRIVIIGVAVGAIRSHSPDLRACRKAITKASTTRLIPPASAYDTLPNRFSLIVSGAKPSKHRKARKYAE